MQLYVGYYHVVNAEIAVADSEVLSAIRFLQADEILGYVAEEAGSRVQLYCCTTMHVCILPGRHKHCCVSNSIATSSSILRTVRTWNRRTFSCFLQLFSIELKY